MFGDRVPVSGNGRYRTAIFTPAEPGTYRFTAVLPGDRQPGRPQPVQRRG